MFRKPRTAARHAAPPAAELFTLEALRRAWLVVRQAGGGPGVDGVTIEQFGARAEDELRRLQHELVSGTYQPQPARPIWAPKRSGGLRLLALWALRDRIAQRAVYEIIAPPFEAEFLPCSYGFRPGRRVEDAVEQLKRYRDEERQWVVNADIKSCFDEIDHRRLMPLVRRHVHDGLLFQYVQGWVEHRILNGADGVPRPAGVSQGNVLSPLLANIFLHPFDQKLADQGLAVLRYADNFVICCRRKAEAEAAKQVAAATLCSIGLRLNPAKSSVVCFQAGFAWLGYFFVRRECYRL